MQFCSPSLTPERKAFPVDLMCSGWEQLHPTPPLTVGL